MAIEFVGAGTPVAQATSTDAVTSNLPSEEILVNDILFFAIHHWDVDTVLVPPDGYALADRVVEGTNMASDLYWKAAGSSETAPTAQMDDITRYITHVVAYRGVDPTNPFIDKDGINETGGASTTTHSAPAIDNTDPNAWAVFFANLKDPTVLSFTPGSGLTERLDTDLGSGVGNIAAQWCDTNGVITTGSKTYSTVSSDGTAIGVMWAAILRPASEGGLITDNFFQFI